jgi:uncharacterized protein (DUF1501 family)
MITRRDLLGTFSTGLGGMAMAELLRAQSREASPHHRPRARRAIQIFLQGGLSHLDSFDYKPELEKLHGKSVPGAERPMGFMGKVGLLHRPHFAFRPRGKSGLLISDLFPKIAERADELTVIRSMWARTGNHTPATYEANSGFRTLGFPAAGAWISYALGSERENLPAFVVIPDSRAWPTGRANNWSSGFLPARHQGVVFSPTGEPVRNLRPAAPLNERAQAARYEALAQLNRRHRDARPGEDALEARIRSYELAARMQLAVPEATDLAGETAETRALYGVEREECADFARSCLMARRLVERGVRFVQLWSGAAFGTEVHWDAHGSVPDNHRRESAKIDQPVAGLLVDLRRRGMLDDTLVIFNTEFGRTPYAESGADVAGPGRDHNAEAFSVWMAGAGLRGGFAYGASDEIGWKAAENPVDVHDFHATILHLMGIDHTKLTFYHNGIQRRLTDVHGRVVTELLG